MTLVDLYATRDENGNPSLGDAVLIVGDGTARIEFRSGHARCEDTLARLIAHRGDVQIPAFDYLPAPEGAPAPPETPELVYSPGLDEAKAEPAEPEFKDESVRLAEEMLRAEGEEVPRRIPAGYEALTADGEPRCLASKADGTQCSNAAREGSDACGLPKHQEAIVS